MIRFVFAIALACLFAASFQPNRAQAQDLQSLLQTHHDEVERPGRRSVGVVLDDLVASGFPETATFLENWQGKQVYMRDADGLFFYVTDDGADGFTLTDISTGQTLGTEAQNAMSQIKPNGGVRRAIGTALVQFQLSDPDIARRTAAVDAIARTMSADQLAPLRGAIENEPDAELKKIKQRLANMLAAGYGETPEERIAAIDGLSGDVSVDIRAVLNQILTVERTAATSRPDGANIALTLTVGDQLSESEAYQLLVDLELAPALIPQDTLKQTLAQHIEGGFVGGLPVAQMFTDDARAAAYSALAADGLVTPLVTAQDQKRALETHVFLDVYTEPNAAITDAARAALTKIETRVQFSQMADLTLDGLSLASIYFLAAIGLAITFGVMGVINMAHGEFIMMGAYTGYVVQQIIPNYTASLIVALPLAFVVTFAAGVAMERLVIRHLYHRPLETLLATFGISVALQQLAKNIFGTQARPLTSPGWLDGALVFNDVIQISYIRIAIFVLALLFLGLLLFILKRTRLGLEVRAVTQNPRMASSMGINPDRINMLTFGLGSGIAGIAGVAIGLYAKVTSEMGADYIVQSFMTVVVGGVGNVWGTLAGAGMIGGLQKVIEWLNPSNTLAAQTYMILFIILFIQFRPKGIVALKGRAAGD